MSETELEKKRRQKRESQARYRARLKRRAAKNGDAPVRELKPHGTIAAYKRHLRERKKARDAGLDPPPICDACKKAWAEQWNEYARAGAERTYLYGRQRSTS